MKPSLSGFYWLFVPQADKYASEQLNQVSELRSAPIREHPATTYKSFTLQSRSTSLEPKELASRMQKTPSYQKSTPTGSFTRWEDFLRFIWTFFKNLNFLRNPLSRQSTAESNDSDTTTQQSLGQSTSTVGSDKQPIKKSPREFIIPISIEGGGVLTPKPSNIEPSESTTTQSSIGSRMSRPRRISSLFNDNSGDDLMFPKLHRHTSIGRESDTEEPRFHSMHRLRYGNLFLHKRQRLLCLRCLLNKSQNVKVVTGIVDSSFDIKQSITLKTFRWTS